MLLIPSFFVAGLILFIAIYLGIKTNILKAPGLSTNSPYSFARVQLMWWTVIISGSFIILFGRIGSFDIFNTSTLILLSIGLVTTAGGKLIDTSQNATRLHRHQDGESHNLFTDILSDENGLSMHRFQAVVFNVLFGLIFIVTFWNTNAFPEFNNSELGLLGVSSGTYLAIKTNENKKDNNLRTQQTQTQVPPTNPAS